MKRFLIILCCFILSIGVAYADEYNGGQEEGGGGSQDNNFFKRSFKTSRQKSAGFL